MGDGTWLPSLIDLGWICGKFWKCFEVILAARRFKKMISIHDDPVSYILDFGNDLLFLNQSIGKNLKIQKNIQLE